MSQLNRELILGFVSEASGYLPSVRAGVATLRAGTNDAEVLHEAYRCVHIIKGASSMVGLAELSHFAFALEEVLELLMHEPDEATPALLDGIEGSTAHIEEYLAGARAGADRQPDLAAAALDHARQLRARTRSGPAVPAAPPAARTADEPPADEGRGPARPDTDAPTESDPTDPAGAHEGATGDLVTPDFPPASAADQAPPDFAPRAPGPDLAPPDFAPAPRPDLAPPDFGAAVKPAPAAPRAARAAITPELMAVFRVESEDHIRTLVTLLPEARTDPADGERWQAIRRAAHSLKGTAGLVGLHPVTQLAHRMEDLLDLYYEGTRTATADEIDLLIAGADLIAESVEGGAAPAGFADLHARLTAVLGAAEPLPAAPAPATGTEAEPAEPEAAEPEPASAAQEAREAAEAYVRVPIRRLDELAKLLGELVITRTAMEQRVTEFARLLGEARPATDRLGRVTDRLSIGYEASALAGSRTAGAFAYAGGGGGGGDESDADGFDALELDRYTEFHLLTRELAETSTDVQTVFGEFGHLLSEFDGQLTRQARLASEAEDKMMRLRMVPLATAAAKLRRTVRTAARTANKPAELVLEGERTGLDKTVLEALADPLMHLLRNAVDHGLEPAEVRLALGKPGAGRITLRAEYQGNNVALTISDDGRGIDFERVREALVRRELLTAEEADALTEEQLPEYLFRPGFSTREEVSELSGRGVGLDVVKNKVEALKGTVAVASAFGRGTTFTIRIPMTLAVIRGLLVRAADQTYAIPLEAVEHILRARDEDVDRVGRAPVLRLGGAVVPLVPLTRALGLRGATEELAARCPVVVLNVAGKRTALAVDQLVGGREVVVKSLGQQLRRLPGVSGATLLGDGSVVLILSPADLVRGTAAPAPQATGAAPFPVRGKDGPSALVVDDSPSVRRVVSGLLTGAGWQVSIAKDGLEALELLQRGGSLPDVVLTDVEMPRMDGYELLATVRADAHLSRLPVAVLTSRSADKHRQKALALGASAYVVKPYQDQNLLDILRQVVRSAGASGTRP